MDNPVDDILSNLFTELPPRYIAPEYNLAQKMIGEFEPEVTMGIPFCVYDYVKDDSGDIVMEEIIDEDGKPIYIKDGSGVITGTEKAPARRVRLDVLAILVWIPACRKRPEITLEEVEKGIGADNLAAMVRSAYLFWGVTEREEEEEVAESGADAVPLEGDTPVEDAAQETS